MTTKRHATIEVSDLVALHLQCSKCGSDLGIPIGKIDRKLPHNCPNCGDRWGEFEPNGPNHTMNYVVEVLNQVEHLKAKMKGAGFTLALELSPDASSRDA